MLYLFKKSKFKILALLAFVNWNLEICVLEIGKIFCAKWFYLHGG